MEIIILDGNRMTSRDRAYEYINKTMRFPEYAGKNLDALHDCLSELSGDVIIIIQNVGIMLENLDKYAEKMLNVFRITAEEAGYTFIEK